MLSLRYYANGTFSVPGALGSWRQQGDVLTEVVTSFLEIHDEETADLIGETFVSELRWIDYDTFQKRHASGEMTTFERCPRSS